MPARTRPLSWPSRVTVLVAAALVALAGAGAACSANVAQGAGTTPATSRPAGKATTTAKGRPRPAAAHHGRPAARPAVLSRVDDGSLGSRATRVACTLLSRAQIGAQFGGPVSGPVPTYPDCEWLVGSDAFLALTVEPGVSFAAATRFVVPLQTMTGIGSAAEIGNNRFLYFTAGGTSFSLLYQLVGDFSSLHSAQLAALARDVVAHHMPRGYVADPKAARSPQPVPAVPPVYFAGDSTAAGPQWAYVNQYETPAIRALCEYQVGSGLLVPSYFDWARHLLAVTAELHPRLVIYMGSANDGQALLVNGAIAAVGSRAWRQAYAKVVGATMTELLAEGTRVLWIGEPAMQDPTLSAEMQAEDQVVAAEAKVHRGVYWFNPGTVLDGPHGSYAGSLMIGGQLTPVRLDGIHLDIAGSLYLARYIARIATQMLGAGGRAKHAQLAAHPAPRVVSAHLFPLAEPA